MIAAVQEFVDLLAAIRALVGARFLCQSRQERPSIR
jgi:hypothetical protein